MTFPGTSDLDFNVMRTRHLHDTDTRQIPISTGTIFFLENCSVTFRKTLIESGSGLLVLILTIGILPENSYVRDTRHVVYLRCFWWICRVCDYWSGTIAKSTGMDP